MSPAQINLYWRKWSACKRALAKLGRPTDDAARHALHQQALGVAKSSKHLTNRDLDRVLAAFASFTAPSDLTQQLRADEQPEVRRRHNEQGCRDLVARLPQVAAAADPAAYAAHYLDSVARSVTGRAFAELDDTQLARIYGILRHRLGKLPDAEPAAEDGDNCPW